MNVLHLPYNISSWASINVEALNTIDGVNAKALILGEKSILHSTENLIYVSQKNKFQVFLSIFKVLKYILWADVLHWYFDDKVLPNGLALKFVRLLKKPALVEWLGSDIRNPEKEFETNEYFKNVYPLIYQNSPSNQAKKTLDLQKRFGQSGFASLTCPDMEQYLDSSLYKCNYSLRQRINLSSAGTVSNAKSKLKIAHAPSKKDVKGTAEIVKVVEKLKQKGYDFDFDLIHNVPHIEALERISKADIFIDQLILGVHGMAALEALSLNKAVLVYIKQSMIDKLPENSPLINANINNLESKIIELIENPDELKAIQLQGRNHVEAHYSTKALTPQLVEIYQDLIVKQ